MAGSLKKWNSEAIADVDFNGIHNFMLDSITSYALDGADTTNQYNMKTDLFVSDTAQSMTHLTYNSGNDNYETTDQSAWADYYMDIYTTSSTGISALAINNCTTQLIYDDGSSYVYRMYSTSGSAEVQRAEVIKTLFYGTTGSDSKVQGITGLTNLKSSDSRDVGKRAYYYYIACSPGSSIDGDGADDNDLSITFNNTSTNTDCSVWSAVRARGDSYYGVWGSGSIQFPTGTTVNSASSSLIDEFGTDTSADEQDNPGTMLLRQHEPNTGGTTYSGTQVAAITKTLILCAGSTSANYTEAWKTAEFSEGSHVDFYTDHSVPLIEAASIGDDAVLVTSTATLASENNAFVKTLSNIDSSNSLTVEFSANNGTNYQTITERELFNITNTGTTGQLRLTITRTDATTTDTLDGYSYVWG